MGLSSSPGTSLAILVVGWILWKILQQGLAKSPLDNIPGLERASLLKGKALVILLRDVY